MTSLFCTAPVDLWGTTAEEAVWRAIASQQDTTWRQLWTQSLNTACRPMVASEQGSESVDEAAEGAVVKGDSNVIVAGFVLSTPCASEGAPESTSLEVGGAPRRYLCASLGSGSRCLAARAAGTNTSAEEGGFLRAVEVRDGHAEVMARRGLLAFLLDLAEAATEDPLHVPFLEGAAVTSSLSSPAWVLRADVRVHLVCTRWMCGALAAVAGGAVSSGHLLLRTGCGCWVSPAVGVGKGGGAETMCARTVEVGHHVLAAHRSELDDAEAYAACGRVKPGRGRPNLTMSCSDKVWRWSVLGLQGRRRAALFPSPLHLSSVHVLQPTTSPPPSAAEREATLARARAVLTWRTQQWWPAVSASDLASVTPDFFLFEATAAVGGGAASVPKASGDDGVDSSYSRSRWLTVHRAASTTAEASSSPKAGCKRVRDEEGIATLRTSGVLRCDWSVANTLAGRSALTLNTKAGLPQGMSARAAVQRAVRSLCDAARREGGEVSAEPDSNAVVARAVELTWRQCPLSRPWMARRVADALGTMPTPVEGEAQGGSAPLTASSSPTACVPLLPMHELAHLRHTAVVDAGGTDGVLFLWSTAGKDTSQA